MNNMDGYITKQQAYDMLRYLDDEYSFIPEVSHDKILSLWYNEINNLSSASTTSISILQWEEAEDGYNVVCSSCRTRFPEELKIYRYCPNCGARMR